MKKPIKILVVGNALSGLCWLYRQLQAYGGKYPDWWHIQVIGKPFKPSNYQALVNKEVFGFLSAMGIKELELKRLEIGYWDGKKLVDPAEGKQRYKQKFPHEADKSLRASAVISSLGEYVLSTPLTPIIDKFRDTLYIQHRVMFDSKAMISTSEELEKWTTERDVIVWATAIQPFLKLAGLSAKLELVKKALLPIDVIYHPHMRKEFKELDYVYDIRKGERIYRYWPKYKSIEIKSGKKKSNERLLWSGDKNLKELWLKPFRWRGKKVIPFARGALIAQIVWRDLFTVDSKYLEIE